LIGVLTERPLSVQTLSSVTLAGDIGTVYLALPFPIRYMPLKNISARPNRQHCRYAQSIPEGSFPYSVYCKQRAAYYKKERCELTRLRLKPPAKSAQP
jgi:hypothetical protein